MYHAPDESTFKARFTESCRRVDDYVQPVPSDAYPAAGTSERVGPVAVAGAFLFGGARSLGVRPRTVAAGVGATVAIVAGVGAIGLHYLVNGLERTVHVTERAAEKARESNVIPPRATHAQSVLEIIKAKEEAKAMKLKAKEEAKIAKEAEKEAKRIAKEELKNEKNAAKVAAAAATTAAAALAIDEASPPRLPRSGAAS